MIWTVNRAWYISSFMCFLVHHAPPTDIFTLLAVASTIWSCMVKPNWYSARLPAHHCPILLKLRSWYFHFSRHTSASEVYCFPLAAMQHDASYIGAVLPLDLNSQRNTVIVETCFSVSHVSLQKLYKLQKLNVPPSQWEKLSISNLCIYLTLHYKKNEAEY